MPYAYDRISYGEAVQRHQRQGQPRDVLFVGSTQWLTSARRYGVSSLACALFSAVYESLSHGVFSSWMVFLFVIPLGLGVVPALMCHVLRVRPSYLAQQLWACGVTTLILGSCLLGVLEIYGTTSSLVLPYFPAGAALLALGALAQARH